MEGRECHSFPVLGRGLGWPEGGTHRLGQQTQVPCWRAWSRSYETEGFPEGGGGPDNRCACIPRPAFSVSPRRHLVYLTSSDLSVSLSSRRRLQAPWHRCPTVFSVLTPGLVLKLSMCFYQRGSFIYRNQKVHSNPGVLSMGVSFLGCRAKICPVAPCKLGGFRRKRRASEKLWLCQQVSKLQCWENGQEKDASELCGCTWRLFD